MRWPSVYLFAWLYGTIGVLLIFFLVAVPLFAFVNQLSDPWRWPAVAAAAVAWLGFGATFSVFPACPRCGRSPYLRGKGFFTAYSSIPKSRCDRCGLNLRTYGLFDPTAKRDSHV